MVSMDPHVSVVIGRVCNYYQVFLDYIRRYFEDILVLYLRSTSIGFLKNN